jgi:hypothetical protein
MGKAIGREPRKPWGGAIVLLRGRFRFCGYGMEGAIANMGAMGEDQGYAHAALMAELCQNSR